MSHDSLLEDLFEFLWHNEALEKSSLSHFSKKSPLEQYWPNLAQIYLTLYHTKCSRDF